jgi:hypothetical protein
MGRNALLIGQPCKAMPVNLRKNRTQSTREPEKDPRISSVLALVLWFSVFYPACPRLKFTGIACKGETDNRHALIILLLQSFGIICTSFPMASPWAITFHGFAMSIRWLPQNPIIKLDFYSIIARNEGARG